MADHRDFNLLFIAAKLGNLFVVNFLLDARFSTEHRDTNAQTLAYKNQQFDVLLSLLMSNLIYPKKIEIKLCPDEIEEFINIGQSLNEAMLAGNKDKVLEILSNNPEMRHFYNQKN